MLDLLAPVQDDEERAAFLHLDPAGFYIRHPPPAHELRSFITPDEQVFQTIHMGAAVIDSGAWLLSVTGLVDRPFALDLNLLRRLPRRTITAVHECFGSPLKPATQNVWRVANVRWTGVRLKDVVALARPRTGASFVWTEGLDRGTFGGVVADRYQKDLPMDKAMDEDVLLAYQMNGERLSKNRGGPVRLVVPGWFGTNSTKWISKIELRDRRAPGPYTTTFYNEPDPTGPTGPQRTMRAVWQMEPNSMIVRPVSGEEHEGHEVRVEGWAWSADGIAGVQVSGDGGQSFSNGQVEERVEASWQKFTATLQLKPGRCTILARATALDGRSQPLQGRRNHCHSIECVVK